MKNGGIEEKYLPQRHGDTEKTEEEDKEIWCVFPAETAEKTHQMFFEK